MKQNSLNKDKANIPPGIKGKILVTGANGQLAKELQRLAIAHTAFDFIFSSKEELPVHHVESVEKAFESYHPDYCINCAAYTAVDKAESEKELAFLVNGDAPGILAKTSKEYNCHFIHVSTDYVFNGAASVPYKEDSGTDPQSIYGASKLEGERQVLQLNPASIIIRTSWVYSEFGKNFVKTMLKLMNEKEEINVVSDQIGSPTYAADLAEAILQIIGGLPASGSPLTTHGIYHFSNAGIISWYDFAVAIKELTGSNCRVNPIPTSKYPTPAKRPAYSVLDKTKIQQVFGIRLKDWRQSLITCIKRIEKDKEAL